MAERSIELTLTSGTVQASPKHLDADPGDNVNWSIVSGADGRRIEAVFVGSRPIGPFGAPFSIPGFGKIRDERVGQGGLFNYHVHADGARLEWEKAEPEAAADDFGGIRVSSGPPPD